MVPLDRALVSSYRLSCRSLQLFGRNLQRKYFEEVSDV